MLSGDAVARLCRTLADTERLLRDHGDIYVSARLSELQRRLAAGDLTAIQSALSESTGSMGSLRDRFLCPENGDRIQQADVPDVNRQLLDLVKDVKARAEDAARAHGV